MSSEVNRFIGTALEVPATLGEQLGEQPSLLSHARHVQALSRHTAAYDAAVAEQYVPAPVARLQEALASQAVYVDHARGYPDSQPSQRGPFGAAFEKGVEMGRMIGQPLFRMPLPCLDRYIHEATSMCLTLAQDLSAESPSSDPDLVRPGTRLVIFGLACVKNFEYLKVPLVQIPRNRAIPEEQLKACLAGVGATLFFVHRAYCQAQYLADTAYTAFLKTYVGEDVLAAQIILESYLADHTIDN
jgi:hypothetical protein